MLAVVLSELINDVIRVNNAARSHRPVRIGASIGSMLALRSLGRTSRAISSSLERLSTGRRINRASDDAAGLAKTEKLTSQIRGLSRSVQNINEASSFLFAADGVLAEQMNMIQRMRELALQSANGSLSNQDRDYLSLEFRELLQEIDRLSKQSIVREGYSLDGSNQSLYVQVGANKGDSISLSSIDSSAKNIFKGNVGNGTFSASQTWEVPGRLFNFPKFGDINNDGHEDILVSTTNGVSSGLFIRLNNGDGTFSVGTTISSTSDIYDTPTLLDLNGDNNVDILYTVFGTNSIGVRMGNGDGTFYAGATVSVGNHALQLTTSDLNNDGKIDIAQYNRNDNTVSIRLGNGDGTFNSQATVSLGTFVVNQSIHVPLVEDFTGDGIADIIFNNFANNEIVVRIGNGDGTFAVGTTIAQTGMIAQDAVLADLNNDGRKDYIIASSVPGAVITFLGNGSGGFTVASTFTTGGSQAEPIILDFDNDGILDLAARAGAGAYIAFGNGNGTFGNTISFLVGNTPTNGSGNWITSEDIDGDGDYDIVVPADASPTFSVIRNNGSRSFSLTQQTSFDYFAGTITPSRGVVAMADVNGDGALDAAMTPHDFNRAVSGLFYVLFQNTEEMSLDQSISIEDQSSAADALSILDFARERLSGLRAELGAQLNRLESASSVASISVQNLSEAKSQLLDADISLELAELIKEQILEKLEISVLAQSNLQMKLVMNLLTSSLK